MDRLAREVDRYEDWKAATALLSAAGLELDYPDWQPLLSALAEAVRTIDADRAVGEPLDRVLAALSLFWEDPLIRLNWSTQPRIRDLLDTHPDAVMALADRALSHPDSRVREQWAQRLTGRRGPGAAALMRRYAADPEQQVRLTALYALRSVDASAAEAVALGWTKSEDAGLRADGLESLRNPLRSSALQAALVRLRSDPSPVVQNVVRRIHSFSDEECQRRKRVRAEHPELYREVLEILFRHDPEGLNYGHNTDEYAPEADRILLELPSVDSATELRRVIHGVFAQMFSSGFFSSSSAGPEKRFTAIAREIWKAWQRHRPTGGESERKRGEGGDAERVDED